MNAADLRAAALSDLRHPSATGQLHILLPDVPGEPFGGTASTVQREAVSQATNSYVPAILPHGKATRPQHLRALLRAWAAAQPLPVVAQVTDEETLNEWDDNDV